MKVLLMVGHSCSHNFFWSNNIPEYISYFWTYILPEHIFYLSIYFTWICGYIFYLERHFTYLNIVIKNNPNSILHKNLSNEIFFLFCNLQVDLDLKIVLQALIDDTIFSNGKAIDGDNRNNNRRNLYAQFKQNVLETFNVNFYPI